METLTQEELNALLAMPEADFERLQEVVRKVLGTRNLVALDREILRRWYGEQEEGHHAEH
jgi:hypothetical protein